MFWWITHVVVLFQGEVQFDTDEHARPDATLEQMAKLPPVFKKQGTVNAANASVCIYKVVFGLSDHPSAKAKQAYEAGFLILLVGSVKCA